MAIIIFVKIPLQIFHSHCKTTTTNTVTLNLSPDKCHALQAYFAHNDWNWDELVASNPVSTTEDLIDTDPPRAEPLIPQVEGEHECPDCFSSPCVMDTRNQQMWWPESDVPPHSRNNKKRKGLLSFLYFSFKTYHKYTI